MEFNKTKRGVSLAGVLILLLGFCLVLAGCESDAVAPQEELVLNENEVAQQAALVAVGISKAGPQLLNYNGKKSADKDLGIYTYTFPESGDVSGTIMLEYFTGGAGGAHSLWNDADYGLLYTTEGEMVTVELDLGDGIEPVFSLEFDLEGEIDQVADTAAVFGTGAFTTGDSGDTFTIPEEDPVVLEAVSTYPEGGLFMYSAGGFDLVVYYDGSDTAVVSITEVPTYSIDLDTGLVTEIPQ